MAMGFMIDGSMIIILIHRIRCTKVPTFRILLAKVEQVFHGCFILYVLQDGCNFQLGVNVYYYMLPL